MARPVYAASAIALMMATPLSASSQQTTTYTYDAQGRLIGASQPNGSASYVYDKAGNRTGLTVNRNHPPVAISDSLTVTAGSSSSINPLSNDTDPDGDPIILTGVSGWNTAKGSVSFVQNCPKTATSCVTYTAASGQGSGSDSFTYTISDGKGGTATGTVSVTINAAAAKPTVSSFTTSVAGNSSNNVLPLVINGTPTSVAVYSAPASASASASGANIYFTPNNGWSGQTSLQYTATNAAGASAPATATINVTPVVGDVHANAVGGQQNAIALAPQTSYASIALVGQPQKGSASISGSTLYYTPYIGQAGSGDLMTYQATSPGGVSNYGHVFIDNITAPNRPPVLGDDYITIAFNTPTAFLVLNNDYDPDGDTLTVTGVTQPSHGYSWVNSDNTVTYGPNNGYSGPDSFTYTVSDGHGHSVSATINITVQPGNQPPTANPGTTDPVWQSTTVYVDPTTNDTDPDGDALTLQSIDSFYCAYGMINGASTCPSDIGSVSRSGNTLIYSAPYLSGSGSPGSNYAAIVVWYTINDGHGHTAQSYQIFNVYGPQ
jgi:YD repeat-containing protein